MGGAENGITFPVDRLSVCLYDWMSMMCRWAVLKLEGNLWIAVVGALCSGYGYDHLSINIQGLLDEGTAWLKLLKLFLLFTKRELAKQKMTFTVGWFFKYSISCFLNVSFFFSGISSIMVYEIILKNSCGVSFKKHFLTIPLMMDSSISLKIILENLSVIIVWNSFVFGDSFVNSYTLLGVSRIPPGIYPGILLIISIWVCRELLEKLIRKLHHFFSRTPSRVELSSGFSPKFFGIVFLFLRYFYYRQLLCYLFQLFVSKFQENSHGNCFGKLFANYFGNDLGDSFRN